MPDLILPSLEIQNFRAFEHLRIEPLGRVNLITGKNNVGKTSLLEALYLYARDGSAVALSELLETRDELNRAPLRQQASENASAFKNLKYLFHGRKELADVRASLSVGQIGGRNIRVGVVSTPLPSVPNENYVPSSDPIGIGGLESFVPYISIKPRNGDLQAVSAGFFMSPNLFIASESKDVIPHQFVRLAGGKSNVLSSLWDEIALTPEEEEVVNSLYVVAPIRKIGFRDRQDGTAERYPVVLTAGMKEPVPLHSMGEGVNRLFGIILALTAAKDGVLLVDEVETGLHYSVMPDVWRLIFQVAQRLNVQVFATTHSWDCIEAFERAAQENDNADGELIRLENHDGDVTATVFDERKLNIATRELIEVR